MQLAGELTAYLNKTYSLNMRFGLEIIGAGKVNGHLETDSLDKINAINAKVMQDREYQALLEKGQGLWLEGGAERHLGGHRRIATATYVGSDDRLSQLRHPPAIRPRCTSSRMP